MGPQGQKLLIIEKRGGHEWRKGQIPSDLHEIMGKKANQHVRMGFTRRGKQLSVVVGGKMGLFNKSWKQRTAEKAVS